MKRKRRKPTAQMISFFLAIQLILTACAAGNKAVLYSDSPEGNPVAEDNEATKGIDAAKPIVTGLIETETIETEEENIVRKLKVQVEEATFTAVLEDNQAVSEFVQMLEEEPVILRMSDYSGFEKIGSLGSRLTTSDSRITAVSGDLVLYQGNQIVIFYGSNSWSYTRIGKIEDLTGWEEALGSGDIEVTFSLIDS